MKKKNHITINQVLCSPLHFSLKVQTLLQFLVLYEAGRAILMNVNLNNMEFESGIFSNPGIKYSFVWKPDIKLQKKCSEALTNAYCNLSQWITPCSIGLLSKTTIYKNEKMVYEHICGQVTTEFLWEYKKYYTVYSSTRSHNTSLICIKCIDYIYIYIYIYIYMRVFS